MAFMVNIAFLLQYIHANLCFFAQYDCNLTIDCDMAVWHEGTII